MEHEERGILIHPPTVYHHSQLKTKNEISTIFNRPPSQTSFGLQMRGKPKFTLLLPPWSSKQGGEDTLDLSLPAHKWLFFQLCNGLHLCTLLSVGSVQTSQPWELLSNQVNRKKKEASFFFFFLFLICWIHQLNGKKKKNIKQFSTIVFGNQDYLTKKLTRNK